MSQITVNVDEAVKRELDKRDRKIKSLQDRVEAHEITIKEYREKWKAIKALRHTISATAGAIDDYYGDDGP